MLSVIVPIHNEPEINIRQTYESVKDVCQQHHYNVELFLIDDGSSQEVFKILESLHEGDSCVNVISLDRHYGKMIALLAGAHHARGDIVITLDADLQYDPYEIPKFVEKIKEGYEVVGGKRNKNQLSISSRLLTLLMNWTSKIKHDDHGCPYNAIRTKFLKSLLDKNLHFSLKLSAMKLSQRKIEIDVSKKPRQYGQSQFTFFSYFRLGRVYLLNCFFPSKKEKQLYYKIRSILLHHNPIGRNTDEYTN